MTLTFRKKFGLWEELLVAGLTLPIANDTYLTWRNAADSADIDVLKVNASDDTVIDSANRIDFSRLGGLLWRLKTNGDFIPGNPSSNSFGDIDNSLANLFTDTVTVTAGNGAVAEKKFFSEVVTLSSGAFQDSTAVIPKGTLLIGVAARVTTTITGPTSIQIGWSGNTDAWADALALTAGTTADNTTVSPFNAYGDTVGDNDREIRITATGGNFTAGAIRVVAWYQEVTAPTS